MTCAPGRQAGLDRAGRQAGWGRAAVSVSEHSQILPACHKLLRLRGCHPCQQQQNRQQQSHLPPTHPPAHPTHPPCGAAPQSPLLQKTPAARRGCGCPPRLSAGRTWGRSCKRPAPSGWRRQRAAAGSAGRKMSRGAGGQAADCHRMLHFARSTKGRQPHAGGRPASARLAAIHGSRHTGILTLSAARLMPLSAAMDSGAGTAISSAR